MEGKKCWHIIWSHRNNLCNIWAYFWSLSSCLSRDISISRWTIFKKASSSDVFAGHNLTSYSPPHSILPLHQHPPWSPLALIKERDGGWAQGSGVFPRGPSNLLPVPLPANLCAFLLQLSEGLTKGQAQLCSNILIIYCSAAHIAVHHHLERSRRLKRSFTFVTEHGSVRLSVSFITSCPFPWIQTRWRGGCGGRGDSGRSSIFWSGYGHLKCVHLFWMSLFDNILLLLLKLHGMNLNSMGS